MHEYFFSNFSYLDIDECSTTTPSPNKLKCDQTCTNYAGGYNCSCGEGYFLYTGNQTLSQVEMRTAVEDHSCFGKDTYIEIIFVTVIYHKFYFHVFFVFMLMLKGNVSLVSIKITKPPFNQKVFLIA